MDLACMSMSVSILLSSVLTSSAHSSAYGNAHKNTMNTNTQQPSDIAAEQAAFEEKEPPPSYVKLAMRNMVKKGGKSLYHFFLSSVALLSLFVGLAYLTR